MRFSPILTALVLSLMQVPLVTSIVIPMQKRADVLQERENEMEKRTFPGFYLVPYEDEIDDEIEKDEESLDGIEKRTFPAFYLVPYEDEIDDEIEKDDGSEALDAVAKLGSHVYNKGCHIDMEKIQTTIAFRRESRPAWWAARLVDGVPTTVD
ncbi:hypothetical protein DFH06DRAFT_1306646, partial [Mycena polygramma]